MSGSQKPQERIPVPDHPLLYQLSHHGDVFLDIDEDTVMMVGPGFGEDIRRTKSLLSKLADKPELAAAVRRYWADRYGIRAGDCPPEPEPVSVTRTEKTLAVAFDGWRLTITALPPLDGGPIGQILDLLEIEMSHDTRSMLIFTDGVQQDNADDSQTLPDAVDS